MLARVAVPSHLTSFLLVFSFVLIPLFAQSVHAERNIVTIDINRVLNALEEAKTLRRGQWRVERP